ncbi:hypothetical protein HAPAU_34180 [Halalkalicoccus paucihalophilus]|uniref:Sugar-specific transcriptional regulator TrmB n=1 Tax=Halalkalicoccus paucihalophilus TaxID=1008153 RepID=A0A151A9X4_9EURY|nr:hypothetical protein HAPAU_34180 [Halalkalicoccus paucihalophilus]
MVSNQKTGIALSSKLVYYVLKNEEKLTRKQITAESRLSTQTTRCGLKRLESSNIVRKEKPSVSGESRNVYSLV